MYKTKQNGDTTQAKRSVSNTVFDKTVFLTLGFDKTVLLIVVNRPKGSIQKKPGELVMRYPGRLVEYGMWRGAPG